MCGIFGGFGLENITKSNIDYITNSFSHRGPDDLGSWIDKNINFVLGFRRLSILDFSSQGNQPMISNNKRWIMVYNGEIYNYLALKKEIKDLYPNLFWKGTSDTEVLLKCIELWGINLTLDKIDGMYAIGLWDNLNKKLFLIKDSFGEKPLYYYNNRNKFFFSSDLSAFKKLKVDLTLNTKAINLFFKYNYIPAPYTIYNECKKIIPGTYKIINDKLNVSENILYLKKTKKNYKINNNSLEENKEILKDLLNNSVKNRMVSDANIGSFLSSGIDSSLVTSIMVDNSSDKIESFSIGFENSDYDESLDAKKIAKYLGTQHNELILSSKDIINFIPKINTIFSEPFADSSQIPTYFVSKFCSNKIKVALTGDGADELFGGYNRHIYTSVFYNKFLLVPKKIKQLLIKTLRLIYDNNSKLFLKKINFLDHYTKNINYENIERIDGILNSNSVGELYENFVNNDYDFYNSDENYIEIDTNIKRFFINENLNSAELIMIYDLLNYLPNDILCKTDRTTMYNSIESRTPYLSKDIIDFSQNIPFNQKISNKTGKLILKNLLKDYIPESLISKKKKGFSIPLNLWMKNELLAWSEDLLSKNNLNKFPYLDSSLILKRWDEHKKNNRNWGKYLWSILVFIDWYQMN